MTFTDSLSIIPLLTQGRFAEALPEGMCKPHTTTIGMAREREIGGWNVGTMNVKWEICKEINTYQMQLIDFARACKDPSQSTAAAHKESSGAQTPGPKVLFHSV